MVLDSLSTSASVERADSVARSVTDDYQMAMMQETISARVMIQANWRVAQPLLTGVSAMGRMGWSRAYRDLRDRKLADRALWRLEITDETAVAFLAHRWSARAPMTGRIAIRVAMQERDIVAILVGPKQPLKTAANQKKCGVVREGSAVNWCVSVREL
jgi:hypothetical protein